MTKEDVVGTLRTHNKVFNVKGRIDTTYIKNHLPDTYKGIWEFTPFLEEGVRFSERIHCLYHGINQVPKCEWCEENNVTFVDFRDGYRETCSIKCGSNLTAYKRKIGVLQKTTQSEEYKKVLSERQKGNGNVTKGPEVKEKVSRALQGRKTGREGKTFEEIFGKETALKAKEKMSMCKKGKTWEDIFGLDNAQVRRDYILKNPPRKDTMTSIKARNNMRVSAIKRIKETNGFVYPGFNETACMFFEHLNEVTNTDGNHALNGGEYFIETLGYFPDYINHDLKMIIEWDEPHHYQGENLREQDLEREKKIKDTFSNYKFMRIKQSEVKDKTFDEIITNII